MEPSLSLCLPETFGSFAGPVAYAAFKEIANTSAFEILARALRRDQELCLRFSTRTTWVEAGDCPAENPAWHIDRVGSIQTAQDGTKVNYGINFDFPSFMIVSFFVPTEESTDPLLDEASTQFFLGDFKGFCKEDWDDIGAMYRDINAATNSLEAKSVVYAGDRRIASYSARTAHRAGRARVPGWRFMLRVGLFSRELSYSPFNDHFLLANATWSERTKGVEYRCCGSKTPTTNLDRRSLSCLQSTERSECLSIASRLGLQLFDYEYGAEGIKQIVEKSG